VNENSRSRTGSLAAVGIAEREFAFEDMPRFVIGVMNVKSGGTAAAPLMYFE